MIHFHMATMPPRTETLKDCIPSILLQCDHFFIYLNNFQGIIPDILKHPKITVFESEKEIGDTGDVGKFYNCWSWNPGYHFTIDDKLIYPKNYAAYTIEKIEKYKRKAVVSWHGRIFPNRKITSYYKDKKEFFGCTLECKETFVHDIGTGVMAFHTDTIIPEWEWFPYMNMTDIYMSLELMKRNIPRLVIDHPAQRIKVSQRYSQKYSICKSLWDNDNFQTEVVNSTRWKIHKC